MTRFTRFALATCATMGATAGIALAAAPAAVTTAATKVSATTATLNGAVSPNGTDTTYYFQYGPSTAYGTQTPTQGPLKGNATKPVSADVAGLAPSTTYHYKLVAVNVDGTVSGGDKTFTTTAAGAPTTNALSIAASHRTVTFGRSTTISGTLTGPSNAGVRVTLEQNPAPYNGGFKSAGSTTTTDATGHYAFVVLPPSNTQYRVTAGAKKNTTTSTAVAVRVRVKVTLHLSDRTPRAGQLVRFSGSVLPGHNGKIARIQRRTASGRWHTVASTTLVAASPVGSTTRSHYAKRLRIRKNGTYRVRVAPADGDHIAGNSSAKKAIVH